ncbi:Non-ribosomal peptide synthase and Polyketide synthase, phosphopantetheine-binding protein [Anopheles sinensis]|uniref:Non-ribosomal peptide synthase and Polyketide synthase, phosphopantetheine-binding protein n=1 Tax=Anopheles sinensis TaxID=74873 RepID=A0A084W3D3_ANOSI|nr:Non-ribosomal peptide synthase and Polyketide synthase, phosphopantetheine-binding protein [Anopheles sinensis]
MEDPDDGEEQDIDEGYQSKTYRSLNNVSRTTGLDGVSCAISYNGNFAPMHHRYRFKFSDCVLVILHHLAYDLLERNVLIIDQQVRVDEVEIQLLPFRYASSVTSFWARWTVPRRKLCNVTTR